MSPDFLSLLSPLDPSHTSWLSGIVKNVEAERRARIEVDQIINQLKEFNASIAEGPSIYETLDKLSEGFNSNGKLSPGLNS